MFLLPKLEILQQTESVIRKFKGLNTHSVIDEAELADCANISTSELPALTVCNPWESVKMVDAQENIALTVCGQSMLEIYKGAPHRLIRYRILPNGTESSVGIMLEVGAELLGVSEFRGELVIFFRKENQYFLHTYKNDNVVAQNIELIDLFLNSSPCFGGLIAFGKRLLILQNDQIHISYQSDLTKWTEYLVDNQIKPTVAQNITLEEGGDFIGGICYKGKPIIFKQRSMYGLYNNYALFYLSKIADVGCINPKSIAECNGTLYFLSEQGLMAYSGGLPKLVSKECPELSVAVCSSTACADGRYYYIGNYFYDTAESVWGKMRADSSVDSNCYFNGTVYYLQPKTQNGTEMEQISRYDPRHFNSELEPDEWYFVTKRFHEDNPYQKQLSKLYIRAEPQQPADIKVWISTDDSEWKELYSAHLTQAGRQKILLRVPPCESCRFKVSGSGKVTIPYIKRIYRFIPDEKVHPFQ